MSTKEDEAKKLDPHRIAARVTVQAGLIVLLEVLACFAVFGALGMNRLVEAAFIINIALCMVGIFFLGVRGGAAHFEDKMRQRTSKTTGGIAALEATLEKMGFEKFDLANGIPACDCPNCVKRREAEGKRAPN